MLRRLRVDDIADSGQTYGGHAYQDCVDTARADGVPIVYPRAGAVRRTDDGVTLRFIGPSLPFIGGKTRSTTIRSHLSCSITYSECCSPETPASRRNDDSSVRESLYTRIS